MSNVILRFKDVAKQYGNNLVLDHVNLDIFAGEIFGIIGASGSGKTTLLSSMIGFLKIDSGDILFKEEHLLDFYDNQQPFRSVFKKQNEVKRIFGFASQEPSFYTKLTVYENLDYFGSLYGLSKPDRRTNIITLLNLMGLVTAKDVLADHLSGGMQKRLDIACALIHDPKVLILDEPTADLDPFLRKHFWKLIKKINKKGTTIVLASHNLQELETLCNRISILHQSKIVSVGTPDQLKDKYSKDEEIHLETFPGNYKKLIGSLQHKNITKMENKGTELVIYTSQAEKVLHELLHLIEKNNESLIDVRLSKPSLDEVFLSLAKKSRKKLGGKEKDD
ncbi:ABC transporter ATP-binding protein [Candidatus Woesearchaeota archaeon]|nr:ABC transporter ATP-binding protein [Candidatus Woesearchaeota archaeon]